MNETEQQYDKRMQGHTTPDEIAERGRLRKAKEIEAMKYELSVIEMWITQGIRNVEQTQARCAIAQTMVAFNRLCNEEVDRL